MSKQAQILDVESFKTMMSRHGIGYVVAWHQDACHYNMPALIAQEREDLGYVLVAREEVAEDRARLAVTEAALAAAEAKLVESSGAHATLEAAFADLDDVEAHHATLMDLAAGEVATTPLFASAWVFGRRTKSTKLVLISLGKLRPSLRSPYIQTLRITLHREGTGPLQLGTCRGNMSHTFHGSL